MLASVDFTTACTYAASQGWLIVEDDTLTLTTAGLAGGLTIGRGRELIGPNQP